jgi:hypothetical protein
VGLVASCSDYFAFQGPPEPADREWGEFRDTVSIEKISSKMEGPTKRCADLTDWKV